MLFRIDAEGRTAQTIASVSFSHLPYHERYDIQEWVLHNPELLGEPLLVVASEYAGFDRTSERLDVLALDRQGKLVVVELKRSARGTTAELQALRYAAYCSTLTLDEYLEGLSEELRPLFQGMRSRLAGEPDVKETVFRSGVSYRRTSDNAWITWLTATKTQARFILPDHDDFPEEMAVKSGGGWTTLRLRGPEELEVAKALLEARLARVRREGGSSVLTPG